MSTIFFYNFILLSSTFFVYLSEKGKNRLVRNFFLGVAFLLVFIPSAIRYDVGTDYLNYLKIFNNSNLLEKYKIKEPLFYFINWFLKLINAHFQWLYVIIAFIFTAVSFKAYPKKNQWLLHLLFFSSIWFISFNTLRQAIALAWSLLGVFYYFNRKYSFFFISFLIASTFHQSALFIFMVGIIAFIPFSRKSKETILPLVFIIIIFVVFISPNFIFTYIEKFLIVFGYSTYANYFSNITYFITRNTGTGYVVLVKIFFSCYLIINAKNFLQINKNYWFLIILIFLFGLSSALAYHIIIFTRMAMVFIIAPIIGGYLLKNIQKNKKIKKIVLTLFLIILLLAFIKESFGTDVSKLNPYQTIFSVL